MSQHVGFNTRKAFVRKISFDAKRLSYLYAQILFKRYDHSYIHKIQLSKNVIKFDFKRGKFVDFKWITKQGIMVKVRAVRTNKNNIIAFYKNIFSIIYMYFYIFALNLLKK